MTDNIICGFIKLVMLVQVVVFSVVFLPELIIRKNFPNKVGNSLIDFIKQHLVNISGKAELLVGMFQFFGSVKKAVKRSEGFPAVLQCPDNSAEIKSKCL